MKRYWPGCLLVCVSLASSVAAGEGRTTEAGVPVPVNGSHFQLRLGLEAPIIDHTKIPLPGPTESLFNSSTAGNFMLRAKVDGNGITVRGWLADKKLGFRTGAYNGRSLILAGGPDLSGVFLDDGFLRDTALGFALRNDVLARE